jgi:hypothetical protein
MNRWTKPNPFDDLQSILDTMNVPESRRGDMKWLARNLGINNGNHPRLDEAEKLVRKLLFIKD